jgi:hypothetical protein
MTSSLGSFVPLVSSAPTAMTNGSYAGLFSRFEPKFEFPAETTTTMPLRHATSAA